MTSAVTTLIVGNLKAVTTTLLGFWLFGRVRLQWFGLAGVLINTLGGIMYSVFKFQESNKAGRGEYPPRFNGIRISVFSLNGSPSRRETN